MVQSREHIAFENRYYKSEWKEWVPGYEGKVRYKDGTFALNEDGSRTVYDGSTMLMGFVRPDGTLVSDYPEGEQEYSLTFLRAAAEVEV